jgi:hypothetical protein
MGACGAYGVACGRPTAGEVADWKSEVAEEPDQNDERDWNTQQEQYD